MPSPKIFLTGASGYVGGDLLYALLSAHPDWESSITLLLRNTSYATTFKSAYPRINLFFASHEDKAAIAKAVAEHDLVLHFAFSADHLPSAEAIVSGLEARGGGIYIHTSGTDVLLDPHAEKHSSSEGVSVKTFDDWEGIGELVSLPDAAPHRNVDKFVLSSGSGTLKTTIICPSTVYGAGRGLISQRSDQIPNLARLTLQQKKGLQLSDGRTFWNCVHVYDLSRLYVRLIEESISDGNLPWNEEGYYLVESGTYFWGDISRRITKEAHNLGLLPSEQMMVVEMKDRDILAPAGRPVSNYAVKAKAVRARKLLGWTPVEGSLEHEIPAIVLAEAKSLGL
ncbi:hypothetical protein BDW72DRAFT_214300 [Aspergillus terricola var. indicus]